MSKLEIMTLGGIPVPYGSSATSTYSHRNGETDAPTVDGWYWFNGTVELEGEIVTEQSAVSVMIFPDFSLACLGVFEKCLCQDMNGEWHGPIVPPWE